MGYVGLSTFDPTTLKYNVRMITPIPMINQVVEAAVEKGRSRTFRLDVEFGECMRLQILASPDLPTPRYSWSVLQPREDIPVVVAPFAFATDDYYALLCRRLNVNVGRRPTLPSLFMKTTVREVVVLPATGRIYAITHPSNKLDSVVALLKKSQLGGETNTHFPTLIATAHENIADALICENNFLISSHAMNDVLNMAINGECQSTPLKIPNYASLVKDMTPQNVDLLCDALTAIDRDHSHVDIFVTAFNVLQLLAYTHQTPPYSIPIADCKIMKPTSGAMLRMVMGESIYRLNNTAMGLLSNDFRISNGSSVRWIYRSMLAEEDRRWQYKDNYVDQFIHQPMFEWPEEEDCGVGEEAETMKENIGVEQKPTKRSLYGSLHHALQTQRQTYEFYSRVPQLMPLYTYFKIMQSMSGCEWVRTDAQRAFLCMHNAPLEFVPPAPCYYVGLKCSSVQ